MLAFSNTGLWNTQVALPMTLGSLHLYLGSGAMLLHG